MAGSLALRLVESKIEESVAAFENLREWLLSSEALSEPVHLVEEEQASRGRELLRLLLQEHIRARGNGDVGPALDVVDLPAEGPRADLAEEGPGLASVGAVIPLAFTHRRERAVDYVSQFGAVDVTRMTYARPGSESVVPLDEEMQLPARSYSYPVQEKVTTGVARGPYLEAVKNLAENTGVEVSSANVDDVIRDAAVDFEAFYATRTPEPAEETGPILVATVDGKGIPMRKLASKTPHSKRLKKGQKLNKKNEARVAAVYTIQPHVRTVEQILKELAPSPLKVVPKRPRPEHKRVWASLEKTKDEIFHEVGREMLRRDPGHRKTWVVVIDGDPALRRRAQRILTQYGTVTIVLDLFHAIEYLWKAGHAFCGEEGDAAEHWVTHRLRMLLEGKVSDVARGMRQAATKVGLTGSKRKAVDTAAGYLLKNKRFMRYDTYLEAGLPIGSGAAEGACHHLAKDRMERTGMSWLKENAEAVLKLRAIELCGDTDEYWQFHIAREQERLHAGRAWAVRA